MSLIKCPECGKDVSSLAEKCIHCGYPLQRQIKYKSYKAMKKKKEERKKKLEKEAMEKKEKSRSIVRCPYCGSVDIRRSMGFVGGFGFFAPSASIGKNWRCKQCGSYF